MPSQLHSSNENENIPGHHIIFYDCVAAREHSVRYLRGLTLNGMLNHLEELQAGFHSIACIPSVTSLI